MLERRDYMLKLSELKKGDNIIIIDINKSLFEAFECEDAKGVNVKATISAVKSERTVEISIHFEGNMTLICGRCLKDMTMKINKTSNLIIKFGENNERIEDDVWVMKENDNKVDLLSFIYEELIVEIPIAPRHKKKEECDEAMLGRIALLGADNKKDDIDPRWEKLRSLKTNKNLE